MKLILIPSLITLGVTILRVVGERNNWSPVFFGKAAGGGGAIVGIAWLPFIFGVYFALKLVGAGAGPSSLGKTFAMWGVGLVLMVAGGFLGFKAFQADSAIMGIGSLVLMVGAIASQFWGWPSLAKVLLAYAYAARIPVLIVMFLAFQGHWGTHYDALPPNFVSKGFATDFWNLAVAPQMFIWPTFTVLVGTLCAGITAAIVLRRKPAAQAA
ncbi:MAG: hypothetical protein ACE145_20000 [Terriglobia bacterium]